MSCELQSLTVAGGKSCCSSIFDPEVGFRLVGESSQALRAHARPAARAGPDGSQSRPADAHDLAPERHIRESATASGQQQQPGPWDRSSV